MVGVSIGESTVCGEPVVVIPVSGAGWLALRGESGGCDCVIPRTGNAGFSGVSGISEGGFADCDLLNILVDLLVGGGDVFVTWGDAG